jgi:SNF2 family DNA or RNA helicase
MKSAWQQDLFKFAMHRSCSVAYGDKRARKKIIEAGSEFVVINFDGLAVVKDEIMAGGFDMIVVDEANAYKNPQTNRWKGLVQCNEENRVAVDANRYTSGTVSIGCLRSG